MTEALERIERMIAEGAREGRTHPVATVNPEFVMRARRDERFGAALEGSALNLADGIGVVWAMRRQGCPQYERVPGSDLVPQLAALCARRGWRPFLLGSRPGVAADAASRLRSL